MANASGASLRASGWLLLLFTGCLGPREAAGDLALKNGDQTTAAKEYTAALGSDELMDFEFERIRDKRLAVVEGEWSPKLDAAIAKSRQQSTVDGVLTLLAFRSEALAATATRSVLMRTDAALDDAVDAVQVATKDDVPERLSAVADLFARATQAHAAQSTLEHLARKFQTLLAFGLPAIPPKGGASRLEALLDWRETVRRHGFPAEVDAAVGREFATLTDTTSFPPATPADASTRFARALDTRDRARQLDAGTRAIALADAVVADARAQVLAVAEGHAKAQRYFAAIDTLDPFAARVEASSPLRAALVRFQTEGAAWHTAQAANVTGYRRLLQLAIAAALSGQGAARVAQRSALEGWRVSLDHQLELEANGCTTMVPWVKQRFPGTSKLGPLHITLTRCSATTPSSTFSRSAPYSTFETYYTQEEVQVGVDLVRVESGSHKEQCSKASSLPGYSWQGLCDVTEYSTKQVPRYETRQVEHTREVQRQYPYTVTQHQAVGEVSGVAKLVADDGSTLEVSFSGERSTSVETWAYSLPSSTTVNRQDLPTGFSADGSFRAAAEAALGSLEQQLRAKVKVVRGRLAREEGKRALAAGDEAGAAEAFLRSVLITDALEGDAEVWLTSTSGLGRARLEGLLSEGGVVYAMGPGLPSLPTAASWTSSGVKATSDGYASRSEALEMDMSKVTSATYRKAPPPNEYVDFHVGLTLMEVQRPGDALASRVAPAVAFDGHMGPLEMFSPLRYGFAVHDEAGLRLAIGMSTAKARDFDNGTNETAFSISVDASYLLVAGLRLPWFSVMAGAVIGYQHYAVGEAQAFGFHFEPTARIALRVFKPKQIILEASGFLPFVPGLARKNRFALSFPLLGKDGVDLKLSVEQTDFRTTDLNVDGKTRSELGIAPAHMVALQVGGRL